MQFSNLTLDTSRAVATLTLNRPDQLNAMSAEMLKELITAASAIQSSDVRAVVISGAGRAFCAGVDLETFSAIAGEPELEARHAAFVLGGDMAAAIETIPQPTVVALHGFVVGGGVVLASACDLRIAAQDTTFSIPEIDLGISLGWGGIERLIREVGPARTREFVMTGRRFSASEAMAAGFVNQVVASDAVNQAAHELAASIAAKPQFAIRATKAHVAEILARDFSRDDALTAAESMAGPESTEARAAYLSRMTDNR